MHDLWTVTPLFIAQEGSSQGGIAELPGVPASGQGGQAATGADGAAPGPTGAQQQQSPGGGGIFNFILPLMLVFLVFMMFSGSRKQKAERRKRDEMLNSLTRNDKVQTVGGIIGTIVESRNDEVTLKVDDATNTRIKFAKSSIQQVLRDAPGKAGANSTTELKPEGATVDAS